MKNLILYTILFTSCLITLELKSQSNMGIAVGYTSMHWNIPHTGAYQELGNWTSTGGWAISIPFEHSLSKALAFQTEFTWIQKGAEVNSTEYISRTLVNSNVSITINYIEIPMLLKASIPFHKMDLQFLGGGYAAIGISAKMKATAAAGTQTASATQDLDFEENMMNRFDAGLLIGTGIQFSNKFFIQAKYNLGLSNIDHSGDPNSAIYNRGLVFSMGTFF
ncbi:MAG: PorT family protein [Saprospiraceae bacterium]|nr:PorT family protein [Saprospiraceae bacterium]